MHCPSCERDNPVDARFCNGCGTALRLACAQCGRENDEDARFCNGCGAMLGAGDVPSTAPQDYTPRHLAERILTQRAALEGERKLVTVLFTDVKGSMEIAAGVDPEIWHEILDGFFAILTEGVHRFEGTVNQYTGDGIMAIFGAPIAHEDHAQRACWAALHMKDDLREFSRDIKRRHGIGFSTRTGLHSGEVVVGKIGDDLRMDYTAQGHTVGLAARMESLAEPNAIYLTGKTAALVDGYFELDGLGDFDVKGVADPVAVFDLLGVSEARTRFDLSLARGLSRFVGRESDFAFLEAAFERARAGRGQVVGIVGEAGVGKSRLCFEFLEACRLKGLRVFKGSAVSHGSNLPAHPMMQVFRDYFGLSATDDARTAREKLAGRIVLLAPELRDSLSLVFEFFGVTDPERPAPPMDPDVRQRRTAELLSRLVQNEETTVSLVEDLHWFDPASEELLANWVEAIAGSPSLLILNFRPEYRADWMNRSSYHQLGLGPLGREATLELLGDLVGDDDGLRDLCGLIADRTAGSPFFTEEVVRELAERGALVGTRGSYRLSSPVTSIDVPQTVQPLLAARIDRLGEREKHVLQAAAVIGTDFDETLLAAVVGNTSAELRESLALLEEGELVYRSALFPRAEYSFRHPLTQEVAYASQLSETRSRLHRSVADSIEKAAGGEVPALLAFHREAAGQKMAAAEQYAIAAEAVSLSSGVDAVRWFHKVRDLTNGETGPDVIDLRKRAALGIFVAGGWRSGMSADEVAEVYADGLKLGAGDDSYLAALLLAYTPVIGIITGDMDTYYEMGAEADRRAAASGDLELRIGAKAVRYYSSFLTNRVELIPEVARDLIELGRDDPRAGMAFFGLSGAAFGRIVRAGYDMVEGKFESAAQDLREAEAIARDVGSKDDLCHALCSWSFLEESTGSLRDGEARARSATALAEDECSPHTRILNLGALGLALRVREKWADALDVYEKAMRLTESTGTGSEHAADLRIGRAICSFELGQLDVARRLLEEALELIDAQGTEAYRYDAGLLMALVLTAEGDARGGNAEIDALLQSKRMPVEKIMILRHRARLASMAGWPDVERGALQEVVKLASAIGADGHRTAAEAGLAAAAGDD